MNKNDEKKLEELLKDGEITEEQFKKMQDGEIELEDMKQVAGARAVSRPYIFQSEFVDQLHRQ